MSTPTSQFIVNGIDKPQIDANDRGLAYGHGCFETMRQVSSGNVIEGTMSNLFAVGQGRLYTPDLTQAGVKGVMREYILVQAKHLGLGVELVQWPVTRFQQAGELFLCNSVMGIWPVSQWDKLQYRVGNSTLQVARQVKHLFDGQKSE